MPLYTIMTEAGALAVERKAALAHKLTTLHVEVAGVPKDWVHIIFQDYPAGSGFTAGKVAPTAALKVTIRMGRSVDYKRQLLERIWKIVQDTTGITNEQLVIAVEELAASQAMEMGVVMPEVSTKVV